MRYIRFSFTIVSIVLIVADINGVIWDDFRVTFSDKFPAEGFTNLPRTVREANSKGWMSQSLNCTNGGEFFGYRYFDPEDESFALLFDVQGIISGLQLILPQSLLEQSDKDYQFDQVPMFQRTIINGINYFALTTYFVSPETICNGGREECALESEGTGNNLFVQNGDTSSFLEVPKQRTAATYEGWINFSCIPGMGSHNFYLADKWGDDNCRQVQPYFAMYNDENELFGYGFILLGTFNSPKLEVVTKEEAETLQTEVGAFPQCLLEKVDTIGLTTMHVYFAKDPWRISCLAEEHQTPLSHSETDSRFVALEGLPDFDPLDIDLYNHFNSDLPEAIDVVNLANTGINGNDDDINPTADSLLTQADDSESILEKLGVNNVNSNLNKEWDTPEEIRVGIDLEDNGLKNGVYLNSLNRLHLSNIPDFVMMIHSGSNPKGGADLSGDSDSILNGLNLNDDDDLNLNEELDIPAVIVNDMNNNGELNQNFRSENNDHHHLKLEPSVQIKSGYAMDQEFDPNGISESNEDFNPLDRLDLPEDLSHTLNHLGVNLGEFSQNEELDTPEVFGGALQRHTGDIKDPTWSHLSHGHQSEDIPQLEPRPFIQFKGNGDGPDISNIDLNNPHEDNPDEMRQILKDFGINGDFTPSQEFHTPDGGVGFIFDLSNSNKDREINNDLNRILEGLDKQNPDADSQKSVFHYRDEPQEIGIRHGFQQLTSGPQINDDLDYINSLDLDNFEGLNPDDNNDIDKIIRMTEVRPEGDREGNEDPESDSSLPEIIKLIL